MSVHVLVAPRRRQIQNNLSRLGQAALGILTFIVAAVILPAVSQAGMQNLPFEEYLRQQHAVSLKRLFANISPADGARGAVIASPSRNNPDYYYHWVRDAALVMHSVTSMYVKATGDERAKLGRMLDEYVNFSRQNQLAPTRTGLGEPKFWVDGRPFDGPWGRPQNDSPALRALTLTRWARILMQEGNQQYVTNKLYRGGLPAITVIKADLEYVSHNWQERSFDLWEEFIGHHFYTRMVQRQALEEGAELAQILGDTAAAGWYRVQAQSLARALESHWQNGRIVVNVTRDGGDYKNSGLDSSTILAILHTGRMQGAFSVVDDRVMATVKLMEEEFGRIYDVNKRGFPAVAIGRYPEDRYYGGNPWVLSTAGFGEFYYLLAHAVKAQKRMTVNAGQAAFFAHVLRGTPQAQVFANGGGELRAGTASFRALVNGLKARGDDYMKRVQLHGYADGGLSEQIRRDNGNMESAHDLTWSYASFLTAASARP